MIAIPKPGSDLWRVLSLVAANDGQLDADAIAGALWPYVAPEATPPLQWSPSGASAALRAWRASIQGRHQARAAWEREHTERAATLLQRLTSIGLLVPARSTVPELSPWFLGVLAEMGDGATDEAALLACLRAGESKLLEGDDEAEPEPRENIPEMLTLIALVRSGPRPTGDLLGKGNGETKRAYRGLIEAGVIVPPTYRRATEKGRELVQNHEC